MDYPAKKEKHSHLDAVNVYDMDYKSADNLNIKGFLITPKDTSRTYPVIIYNRGGNGSFGMVSESLIVRFLSRIASHGFIVIGSQLRGSEGSEGVDEFGGREIEDVLSLFPIIGNLKSADTAKIGQIGWSRGGITNFQLLKKSSKLRTTVNIAGPSDILKTKRKIMFEVYRNRVPNYAIDSIRYANKVSPLFQIDSIRNKSASFLYIHGNSDTSVDIENSRELHAETLKRNLKSELIIFPGGEHGLREQYDALIDKIVSWLRSEFKLQGLQPK
ncbi:prolyl oligopeptidase family serine peptidase [uncultured Flavobacterium sp.]|uniref:alpha/beta hydrolase family protein n=1 Tax=uncultured Flavobacterium sp. TaxID=165435 RepID=UPI0025F1E8D5|nr:prolyl oligopeptidase family serine peptidase [uncultured Flavobacterium sp.]